MKAQEKKGQLRRIVSRLADMVWQTLDAALGDVLRRLEAWGFGQWCGYVRSHANAAAAFEPDPDVPLDLLEQVRSLLPTQPWPTGIHRVIADQLNERPKDVSRCITELIRRGDFVDQIRAAPVW